MIHHWLYHNIWFANCKSKTDITKNISDAESGSKSPKTAFHQPITLQIIPVDTKMSFKSMSGISHEFVNLFYVAKQNLTSSSPQLTKL